MESLFYSIVILIMSCGRTQVIQNEIKQGNVTKEQFTANKVDLKFHGHCHQKAQANQKRCEGNPAQRSQILINSN